MDDLGKEPTPGKPPRELSGWRAGRPAEDPAKIKRWGIITARPSEYLIHVRGGTLRTTSSGQGATCFKLPWDSVAVVPTSLQRLQFRADQVTLERVGVEIVGLAVYRIADPMLAYRVLNFSYPERAQEKLVETLSAMFAGASRRLIANLPVDDCLQRRKETLAAELLREVAPIVGGEGRPDDVTAKGWGVVIDTIEIQEVRILSEKVFQAMQAPFRAALDRQAREARAAADQAIAEREAEARRAVEEARLRTEMALAARRHEQAKSEAEARKALALQAARHERDVQEQRLAEEAALALRRMELERAEADARTQAAVHRAALLQTEAEAELAAHAARAELARRRAELGGVELAAETARRGALAEATRVEGLAEAEVALHRARAEREAAEAQARVTTAQNLPALAAAVGQKFGEVRVTQFGGEGAAFGAVAQAVASVLALAKDDNGRD